MSPRTLSFTPLLALLGPIPLAASLSLPLKFTPRQATPGFKCEYQPGWQMCHEKGNRHCWVRSPDGMEYNNATDYEKFTPEGEQPAYPYIAITNPNTGITRTYDLTISQKSISPDGTEKKEAKLVNGQFPGTPIEACWGDTVIVNVKNEVPKNGTTLHWHGLRMLNENHMDGTNGVTQCPTANGEVMQYKFKVRQYGTSWYHSHYSSQYSDGVLGPMIIHGPQNEDWDEELAPIVVNDWVHKTAFELFKVEMAGVNDPQADSILVNGVGRFNGGGDYFKQTFEAGKRYLVRIINASTGLHFHFSLDNHVMRVIAADLVPIEPFTTNSLSIGVGQRYTVIIEAKPTTPSTNGRYWMRTEYTVSGCNTEIVGARSFDPNTQRTGIISYTDATGTEPSTSRHPVTVGCLDESPKIKPSLKWTVSAPMNDIKKNTYEGGLDQTNENVWHGAVKRWSLTDTPLWLDMSNPTIMNLNNETWNPEYGVVKYDQTDPEKFVYLVITYGLGAKTPSKLGRIAHPVHLHGHDFAIIGQGTTAYDPDKTPATFNLNNPPRRDVAMLPRNGYLAIAWKPDNPGAWLLHCHIAWHAGSGMALQVLERQSEIEKTIGGAGVLGPIKDQCDTWKTWLKNNPDKFDPTHQEDSGI